jgi:gluconate 2-dehydrogenase gamma chain
MQTPRASHRRIFLKQIAAVVGATPLAGAAAAVAATPPASGPRAGPSDASAGTPLPTAWLFFNAEEARTADAAVARLIPADDDGPGAREAGVVVFLDRQLAGAWGHGDHFYRKGPFLPGTPGQGYQLAFTPAEMFRLGFAKLDENARKLRGAPFADLAIEQQDELLSQAEHGKLDFGTLPSVTFFASLVDATMEGFFSDPIHGGNRDKIGWKLVGFPGVHASYANDIERHNVPWTRVPASIADATGRAA